jgi:uncharacterized integral membrane protein
MGTPSQQTTFRLSGAPLARQKQAQADPATPFGAGRSALVPKETVMRFRTLFVFLLLAVTGVFALLNWEAFTTPTTLSLAFATVQAPIGLLMLGVVFVLGAMCLAVVIYVQGTAMAESRRQAKELQAQRELADTAEASRFTELRGFIDAGMLSLTRASADLKSSMLTRLDQLEQRNHVALQETANSLYAHMGELEDRLEHRPSVPAAIPLAERPRPEANARPR